MLRVSTAKTDQSEATDTHSSNMEKQRCIMYLSRLGYALTDKKEFGPEIFSFAF